MEVAITNWSRLITGEVLRGDIFFRFAEVYTKVYVNFFGLKTFCTGIIGLFKAGGKNDFGTSLGGEIERLGVNFLTLKSTESSKYSSWTDVGERTELKSS